MIPQPPVNIAALLRMAQQQSGSRLLGFDPNANAAPSPDITANTAPPSAPQNGTVQGSAPRPSVWDSVFGSGVPAGTFDPAAMSAAKNSAMLHAGLSLLASGGRQVAPPNFGQGLLGALDAGQNAYKDSLQGSAQAAQYGKARQQELIRNAIYNHFAPADNETPEQTAKRLTAMLPYLMQINDPNVGHIVDYLDKMQPKGDQFGTVGAGDQVYDKRTGKLVPGASVPAKPTARAVETYKNGNMEVAVDKETGQLLWQHPSTAVADPAVAEARRATTVNQLSTNYNDNASVKAIAVASQAYTSGMNFAGEALKGNPQSQQALLLAFMKSINPTIRANMNQALTIKEGVGIPDKIRVAFNNAVSGQQLSPQTINNIISAMTVNARGWADQNRRIIDTYSQRARALGVDPGLIINDPFAGTPLSASPSATVRKLDGMLTP